MADFCNQCAREHGLPEGDLRYQRKDEAGNVLVLEEGMGWSELCEGCGPTVVDDDGNCIADNCEIHGRVEVKEFKDFKILPPPPNVCQECAVDHRPELPHNQQSLFYQYKFYHTHGRWPTWKDAMEHCSEEMKQAWVEALATKGVVVE